MFESANLHVGTSAQFLASTIWYTCAEEDYREREKKIELKTKKCGTWYPEGPILIIYESRSSQQLLSGFPLIAVKVSNFDNVPSYTYVHRLTPPSASVDDDRQFCQGRVGLIVHLTYVTETIPLKCSIPINCFPSNYNLRLQVGTYEDKRYRG